MEGTMAEIRMFGGDFTPRNWAICLGQTLAVNQNQALFSLLGTIYGGDGISTFMLPDFSGRAAVSPGTGPGLPTFVLGEIAGASSVTLNVNQMPVHQHGGQVSVALPASSEPGSPSPSNANFASVAGLYSSNASNTNLKGFDAQASVGASGGNQPISVMQPNMAINFIICLTGIYPSRS